MFEVIIRFCFQERSTILCISIVANKNLSPTETLYSIAKTLLTYSFKVIILCL